MAWLAVAWPRLSIVTDQPLPGELVQACYEEFVRHVVKNVSLVLESIEVHTGYLPIPQVEFRNLMRKKLKRKSFAWAEAQNLKRTSHGQKPCRIWSIVQNLLLRQVLE